MQTKCVLKIDQTQKVIIVIIIIEFASQKQNNVTEIHGSIFTLKNNL